MAYWSQLRQSPQRRFDSILLAACISRISRREERLSVFLEAFPVTNWRRANRVPNMWQFRILNYAHKTKGFNVRYCRMRRRLAKQSDAAH